MKDTNGDDKADVRETLITGWGTNDTHALASNLKYGLDNWLWGTVGYSGFRGTVGGKELRFAQAVSRFTSDGQQIEHIANFTNNTWGLAFDETFDVFGSTANNEHSVYVAIPLRDYEGVAGLRRDGKKKIDGHYALQANTQKIRQADSQGGFTAGGRPQLLHGARVSGGVLESHRVRERADRARRPPRDHSEEGLRLRGSGRLESRGERRRVVRAGARGSRP